MVSDKNEIRRVRALFNPKSGLWTSTSLLLNSVEKNWDIDGIDISYQVSKSIEDGVAKTKRAIDDGVDTIIVIGGDGMVNSIGSALIGTDTALAVIPTGSGNGFARHFDISRDFQTASKALVGGKRMKIDVGYIDNHPFFVTCGLAWDADLVKGFDESPVRGIMPYVFSGIYSWFTYEPQNFKISLDDKAIEVDNPVVLTVANLTQYGGGAKIAPNASPNDGLLELVEVPQMEPLAFATQVRRLFDGTIRKVPNVKMRRFKRMEVVRERAGAVQVDGELLELGREFVIEIHPQALEIIIPK